MTADWHLKAGSQALYLHLRQENGQVSVEGHAHAQLGHPIESDTARDNPYEGVYVSWSWDGRQLTARNDRYGLKPLFYLSHGNDIIISGDILPLMRSGLPLQPNYPGLAVFFRIGHFIGNDTPFENIKLLPPNSVLNWEDGQLSVQSNPVSGCFHGNSSNSRAEALEGYQHYFKQALAKRTPEGETFIVPLSGGRDSRHILFELNQQGYRPGRCVTLRYRPPATNEDERIAGLICRQLGLQHDIVDKPQSWFKAVLQDLSMTNYCGGGHSWILPLLDYYADHHPFTLYDGLAGDVLTTGHTLTADKQRDFLDGNFEPLAERLLNEAEFEPFNQAALPDNLYQKISFGLAKEHLIREMKRHADANNPALSYTFWNRTRRAIASIPYSIMSPIDKVHCPFVDHEFFDYCTGLPSNITLGKSFHDEVIENAYPEYAAIPYEDKTLVAKSDSATRRYYRQSVLEFIRYLAMQKQSGRKVLKKSYILRQIAKDLATGSRQQPWYLRRALYLYELQPYLK